MKKPINLLCTVLMLLPTWAMADNLNNSSKVPLSQTSLLAAQPAIAKPNLYKGENNNTDNSTSTQNKDVLIIPPKDVIGGSTHQNNDIRRYLGINY